MSDIKKILKSLYQYNDSDGHIGELSVIIRQIEELEEKQSDDSKLLDWIDENKYEIRWYGTDLFEKSCFQGSCWARDSTGKISGINSAEAPNIRDLIKQTMKEQ